MIGNYVEIGAGAVILGGIHIGDHAAIGANTVVMHDVPPYTVAVGMPAKKIGLVRKLDEYFLPRFLNGRFFSRFDR